MIIPVSKADLVIAALRKAALASEATLTEAEPQSVMDGLADLEMMIYEWAEDETDKVIDTGYHSADPGTQPDSSDPHGVKPQFLNAVINNLATRMLPDYKTPAADRLRAAAISTKANMVRICRKNAQPARYRRRTPLGSGNRMYNILGWRYFHEGDKD